MKVLAINKGDSRKLSIPYHRRLFRNSEGKGGSLNWKSEGTYWNSEGVEEFKIWNFHRGQTKRYSLKMLIL